MHSGETESSGSRDNTQSATSVATLGLLYYASSRLYHGYTPGYHHPYPYLQWVYPRVRADSICVELRLGSHTDTNTNAENAFVFAFVCEQV